MSLSPSSAEQSRTQPNFDRVARVYRWAEYIALGPALQRTRTHFLCEIAGRRRALVLGDGDGRFLAEYLNASPDTHVLAVDTSAAMLGLLRERCLRRASRAAMFRLRTAQASALDITPSRDTDLVVTHFFLDCFTQAEVDLLLSRFVQRLAPGALWLISDFGEPESRVLRPLAAVYIRALYFAFRLTAGLRVRRLPDPQLALTAAGFVLRRRATRLGGLLYTELWELPQDWLAADRITSEFDMAQDSHPDTQPHFPQDAQPDPEPPVPPLNEPDPGVFHHLPDPDRPEQGKQA